MIETGIPHLQAAVEHKTENRPDDTRHFKVCTGLQPNFPTDNIIPIY